MVAALSWALREGQEVSSASGGPGTCNYDMCLLIVQFHWLQPLQEASWEEDWATETSKALAHALYIVVIVI